MQTRVGTLKFSDGLPDDDTVKKVYDHLDFARGVEAFMAGIPATSVEALKRGFIEAGFPPNSGIGITESRSDARSLFLTPNATVIYQWACVDVEREPMVIEVAPAVLGLVNDAYFRFLGDMGQFGPDQGKGGKFLLVPEGYTGTVPKKAITSSRREPTTTWSSFVRFCRTATWPAASRPRKRRPGSILFRRRPIRPRRSSSTSLA